MRIIFLLILLGITSFVFTQAPVIQWEKSFGGTSNDGPGTGNSIQQTIDGGYIVLGKSNSNNINVTSNQGLYDCWVVKLNNTGDISWQKSFGGTGNEWMESIVQTSDGGYIAVGRTNSNDGDLSGNHGLGDAWIIKLDVSGNITWQKLLGGSDYDGLNSIVQTSDGGFIAVGFSNSNDGDLSGNHGLHDAWIIKLDVSGNITWQKLLGGSDYDNATSIIELSNGTYVIAGSSASIDGDIIGNHGLKDFWIFNLDSSGNIIWSKLYGGSDFESPYGDIQMTLDGGFIVAGRTNSIDGNVIGNHGLGDGWIIKLDEMGNSEWQLCLGGSADDEIQKIRQKLNGGYLIAGTFYSNDGDISGNHGQDDCWIASITSNGLIEWQKSLGGTASDYARDIIEINTNEYVVVAESNSFNGDVTQNIGSSDFWIVKLSNGNSNVFEEELPDGNQLLKIINLLGQEVEYTPNTLLIYQYSNGKTEKVFTLEK
jgi:hypothetical protein